MGKQKRSANTYQKINTIFMRDTNNIIMPHDELVDPSLEYLRNCKFDCEEKIDGTNIRIEVTSFINYEDDFIEKYGETGNVVPEGVGFLVEYKGKTDNAQIPKSLLAYLKQKFPEEKVLKAFGLSKYIPFEEWADHKWESENDIPKTYTIYGEGYGAGIQSGGYYRQNQSFIGFDVKVGDMYLLRENRDDILTKLGADIVPFMGQMTIDEAIEYVKTGFLSVVAQKEHLAEGLVCRTPLGLCDRRGNRIIFKVKTCDWNKYYNKYGTYDKVEQTPHKNV